MNAIRERVEEDSRQYSGWEFYLQNQREKSPAARVVVAISDLDDNAAEEQEVSVLSQALGPRPVFSRANVVKPYSTVSAAHALAARLSKPKLCPPGSIFIVTVDPHVGKNASDGKNIADRRALVKYDDDTVIIGPNRPYLRTGEFHGRGNIVEAYEVDKQKLIDLGFTVDGEDDVFDGLSRFGPAAAAVCSDIPLQYLGDQFPVEEIPELSIPKGAITDIEEPYGNIRAEVPCEEFPLGSNVTVRNGNGELLCVAKRSTAFTGEKGTILATDGSKACIQGSGRALYLVAVQDSLVERLDGKLEVGDVLDFSPSQASDIIEWTGRQALSGLKDGVSEILEKNRRRLKGLLGRAIGRVLISCK